MVARAAGRQHPVAGRSRQAPVQRRRVADLFDRHLGRCHRRLFPGHARADAVVVGAAAHRPPRGAGQSVDRGRRRPVRLEPRQPAVLHRQRGARSAVSRGAGRAVPRGAGNRRRVVDVPSAGHRRARHLVVGERAAGLRGVRARSPARPAPAAAVVDHRTHRSLQPHPVAGDRRAGRARQRRRAGRRQHRRRSATTPTSGCAAIRARSRAHASCR